MKTNKLKKKIKKKAAIQIPLMLPEAAFSNILLQPPLSKRAARKRNKEIIGVLKKFGDGDCSKEIEEFEAWLKATEDL